MATGIHKESVAAEFLEHANEEQAHADKIAERIKQLGGKPEMNPAVIAQRAHSEYVEGESLADMIKENLVAERIAIQTYREIVNYFGDGDPTSRIMMEGILANEEEHADDMADLLFAVEPASNEKTNKLFFDDEVSAKSDAGDAVKNENALSAQKKSSAKKKVSAKKSPSKKSSKKK